MRDTVAIDIIADDIDCVVDRRGIRALAGGGPGVGVVARYKNAVGKDEAMRDVRAIDIIADDLAGAVDRRGNSALAGGGPGVLVVAGHIGPAYIADAMIDAIAIGIIADDLACVVDRRKNSAMTGRRARIGVVYCIKIYSPPKSSASFLITVQNAIAIDIDPNDIAQDVDRSGNGALEKSRPGVGVVLTRK